MKALAIDSQAYLHKVKTSGQMKQKETVDEFMEKLDHPLKAEAQTVRGIIKSADPGITEEIKWNAPSFRYQGEYLVTFNLRETKRIHLVFHNPEISKVKSDLLEGSYVDRRMAYFTDMDEIDSKKTALIRALKDLIRLQKK